MRSGRHLLIHPKRVPNSIFIRQHADSASCVIHLRHSLSSVLSVFWWTFCLLRITIRIVTCWVSTYAAWNSLFLMFLLLFKSFFCFMILLHSFHFWDCAPLVPTVCSMSFVTLWFKGNVFYSLSYHNCVFFETKQFVTLKLVISSPSNFSMNTVRWLFFSCLNVCCFVIAFALEYFWHVLLPFSTVLLGNIECYLGSHIIIMECNTELRRILSADGEGSSKYT